MAVVPTRICELVETFDRHIEAYRSQQYNETQVRREFIDPFFEELGWDVTNKAGYAQAYKDVIHEDAIKIGGATKAPDYCFRIGGARKFFLEAKKPSVDIKGDPHPAYQLRRYAWSAKLPLSVLTDFEEFAVYDCRMRPKHTDRADVARIMLFTYKDYLKNFSEIADIFSKESILKGSFDKFAAATKGKRGTSTVDKEFLAEIEKWRNMLARIIALRNRKLSVREINFSVQRTIDRILFLRMCEDRGIETYGQLQSIISGERTYPRLCEVFEKADQKYNSGLFHFHEERDRSEGPDELTPNIIIDDKDLKWILHSLYYPQSPYEFSVLPAEILGNVYEQFLGKVITLTSGHRASVEDKSEVKKAGGVYYTPSYIVDYIVKNTVGRLLGDVVIPSAAEESIKTCRCEEAEGRRSNLKSLTPRQVSNIKILDPACGSGSFLIGAYQYLLDWHLKYYTENDPEKYKKGRNPKIYETNSRHSERVEESQLPHYRLTITEKKRILINNIFGVDIDSQAVEVTKLSLLLKVLEGESSETIDNQYRLFHERALPDLANNIKCGNSLIGPDFYDTIDSSCHSREGGNLDELRDIINAFDWHTEFPEIFNRQNPGFDSVIGNPPYRMLQPHNTDDSVLAYLRKNYVAAEFKIELFHIFLQRGVSLLKHGAYLGHIVPTTILNNVYAQALREWIMARCCIENISVARNHVFAGADVHTSVITLRLEGDADKRANHQVLTTLDLSDQFVAMPTPLSQTQQARFVKLSGHVWNILINERNAGLITRLIEDFSPLKALGKINRGLISGDRAKFFSKKRTTQAHVPIIAGRDVQRYFTASPSEYVLFERPDTAGGCWDKKVHFAPHKIVVRQIGVKPTASILREPIAVTGNIFTVRAETLGQELYLLGIINSRLTDFFWRTMFADFKSSFPQVTIFSLAQLPIRVINFSGQSGKSLHDQLIKLVERMLDLHKELATAKVPTDKIRIQRQIDATDKQINNLVYELYDLTEEEIKIVEENT